jgi:hypothetical protein
VGAWEYPGKERLAVVTFSLDKYFTKPPSYLCIAETLLVEQIKLISMVKFSPMRAGAWQKW